eukprot:jgi/Chlat1/7146/Chrsp57S06820
MGDTHMAESNGDDGVVDVADCRAAPAADAASASAVAASSGSVTGKLSNELIRRTASDGAQLASSNHFVTHVFLCDEWHDGENEADAAGQAGVASTWRMKDRMKTVSVALVLCLNIGVDPPDVIKISPCARTECWTDPFSMNRVKALEKIGANLQLQYERWQPRARYKMQLDPTVEEVRKLCTSCRRNAKSERVLFHYNGHGVPRPTANGEIWVFNKSYTQYIPLSVYDLQTWTGTPSIYVFDCSSAGMIVNAFLQFAEQRHRESELAQPPSPSAPKSTGIHAAMKDVILLAASSADELLPQDASLPADVFTACLTTPIKIALKWFVSRSLLKDSGLKLAAVDNIPGQQNNRKTPLGELNWIFTAITDTIAWNVLPRDLFQKLFRQDLLVASLFRNFLLAERVMRSANCHPVSYPRLPPTSQHPMWQAWDMAAEMCLAQLPSLGCDPNVQFEPSPFFTEQLTAFDVWLEHGSEKKQPPEQLPIVLQVLLSQSHRLRALVLLGRFLDMGAWAVDLALSVGIFPYVLKLLQTQAVELREILVFIWTKIMALDKSCQVDLVKDGGHNYFVRFLDSTDVHAEQRAMAAFVLAVICDNHLKGQQACMTATPRNLMTVCFSHLPTSASQPLLQQWLCLCLAKLWESYPDAQTAAFREKGPELVAQACSSPHPEVRAAAVYTLGLLVATELPNGEGSSVRSGFSEDMPEEEERWEGERRVASLLLPTASDGCHLVRMEFAIAMARFSIAHSAPLRKAAAAYMKPPATHASSPAMVVPSMRSSVASHGRTPSEEGIDFSQSWRRATREGGGMYTHMLAAVYGLARDPHPQVAALGAATLRSLGVEYGQAYHLRETFAQTPSTSTQEILAQMQRSSSWSKLTGSWKGSSPPQSASMLRPTSPTLPPTGAGLRKTTSSTDMFSSLASMHASNAGSSTRRYLNGSENVMLQNRPVVTSQGPASPGPLLSPSGGLAPIAQSSLYTMSCKHFSRPLLEQSSDDYVVSPLVRQERERSVQQSVMLCQRRYVGKFSDQIASFDMDSKLINAVVLHPFLPLLIAADDKDVVRVWNYDANTSVCRFLNGSSGYAGRNSRISHLTLVNELENALLLVGNSDGAVRVWRDFMEPGRPRLAAAWQAISGHRPGARNLGAVVEWNQYSGLLYAGGDISTIRVWDLEREICIEDMLATEESSVSCMSSSHMHGSQLLAGCANGTVLHFDLRTQRRLVSVSKPHTQSLVGIDMHPCGVWEKRVTAAVGGDIKIFDNRGSSNTPIHVVQAHSGTLSTLAVHRHAQVLATGGRDQYIKVFDLEARQLSVIRYHNSFLKQRIGPVSSLAFHPYKLLMGAGSIDSNVSLYMGEFTGMRQ